MKNNIILSILSLLFLTIISQYADAQDYVITTRGDSLTGEVKPLLYGPEKKVQLIGADNEKTSLSLFEIRAFRHKDEIFHPVKGDNGYAFMKLVQPGYLSLYAFQPENQTRFDGLLLKKMDGATMVVPNLGFRKYISQFLEDCPDVSAQVKDGAFSKKELDQIIARYNECIAGRTFNHEKVIAVRQEQAAKINVWHTLAQKISEKDFSEKTNALDMIAEIRKKIQRQEKIPNFLIEGLKASLENTGLSAELDAALQEIQQ